jgi:FkbM family methyltransferase
MLDLSIEKYLWIGTYEPWVQDAIAAHLRPGMRAWDVGGFIGYHTMAMLRTSPAQVLVLEPDPDNRRRLETTLRLNEVSNVLVLPVAAGRASAAGALERAERNPSETRIRTGGGQSDLRIVPLDEVLDEHGRPDLVKLDVEGLEADVLEGAPRLIDEARPVWIIEVHGGLGTGKAVASRLRGAGYRVQRLGTHGPVDNVMEDSPGHILAVP